MCEVELNNEAIEIRLLLEAIHLKYGYDFRGYSKSSLTRRVLQRFADSGLSSISEMQHRVLNDTAFFETLLLDLSINVTAMFRDPSFYLALRAIAVPALRKMGYVKVWCAGCATGEEVYSMAILLAEAGLHDHAQIYATDINEVVLRQAAAGIYPIDRMREYTKNYQMAGGQKSFADYFTADDRSVVMRESLKANLVFSDHNLATDAVFGEMDLVSCRNVLIYFGKELQNRVFKLFHDSLRPGGFLCLGSKESAAFNDCANRFHELSRPERIYRKIGGPDVSSETREEAP